ncbi:MAG: radical SAM protein [Oscillospiraceae bacterium]|nr:radical SAM protein [Oscillospiraceae bacterium]
MSKTRRVAVFIPHAGCPHACCFCDQRAISGQNHPPTPAQVRATLSAAADTLQAPAEIAFFGGSFTAVDANYRRALLDVAGEFLTAGHFTGIRISTRPDAVDREILRELAGTGVTAIELGAQSMNDRVLNLAGRGHTTAQTAEAAKMIRESGFSLGLQMMTGLPGDDAETTLATARALANLTPDTIRIYPTLVLAGSGLTREYTAGRYIPQTLGEAVDLCAELLKFFAGSGIKVIRLGLQQESTLMAKLVAGPHHPAFRELVEGKILLEQVTGIIRQKQISPGRVEIEVAPGAVSKMAGQNRRNITALEKAGYNPRVTTNPMLNDLEIRVAHSTPRR